MRKTIVDEWKSFAKDLKTRCEDGMPFSVLAYVQNLEIGKVSC